MPFTYGVWIKFTASQNARTIIGRHDDASGGSSLGIDDGAANKIKFHLNSYNTQRVNSLSTLNDGVWHHVIGTWNGSELRLYIDGVLNNSNTVASTLTYPALNTQIGRWVGGSSQYFNGYIDEPRIWNRSLSAAEVLSYTCLI
jgi:hypothetical protein